mmetsp:Transcript_9362/g.57068  ORF Transcript_9362/g.57068 Transcript_9362/m.57068 type:complete len:502 (+) Transcript_9362:155-1660(+)
MRDVQAHGDGEEVPLRGSVDGCDVEGRKEDVDEKGWDVDTCFVRRVGECGRGQRWRAAAASLAWAPGAVQTLVLVFAAQQVPRTCLQDDCEGCRDPGWTWQQPSSHSVVSTFDLVCERAWMLQFLNVIYFFGFLFGAGYYSSLSDRTGRKRALFLSCASSAGVASLSAIAPNYWTMVITRCMTGFTNAGIGLAAFVLTMEYVGPNVRGRVGLVTHCFFTAGLCLLPAVAYFVRNWRVLMAFSSLSALLYLPVCYWLPESPRWLLVHGKHEEARTVLESMAEANGTHLGEVEFTAHQQEEGPRPGLKSLLGTKERRSKLMVLTYTWCMISAVYYGLQLGVGDLAGTIYINFFLQSIIEVPSTLTAAFTVDHLGRRPTFVTALLGAAAGCFVCALSTGTVRMVGAIMGKFFVTGAFNSAFLYTSEMFPTVVRNGAVGLCSQAARIGGIVAPAVIYLGTALDSTGTYYVVFGLVMAVAGLLSLNLPETRGAHLSDALEDAHPPP